MLDRPRRGTIGEEVAAFITLQDGRSLHCATAGWVGVLMLIERILPPEQIVLKSWVRDMSERPAPFLDIDLRGLSPDAHAAFFSAAEAAASELESKFGTNAFNGEFSVSGACLGRLLKMMAAICEGADPQVLDDGDGVQAFDGETVDLSDLWDADGTPQGK